jgi:hypothetical protein
MAYDAGLAERVSDVLRRIGERGVRQKNVFGGRGFLAGRSAFVIVWGDEGLIVKTPRAEYQDLLQRPGVVAFAPDGERSMTTWVVVATDVIADDPELEEWVRKGLAGVR